MLQKPNAVVERQSLLEAKTAALDHVIVAKKAWDSSFTCWTIEKIDLVLVGNQLYVMVQRLNTDLAAVSQQVPGQAGPVSEPSNAWRLIISV